MVYAVDGGGTVIVLPKLLVPLLGNTVRLGVAYYGFMSCLAIFCTNSINILAGGKPRTREPIERHAKRP